MNPRLPIGLAIVLAAASARGDAVTSPYAGVALEQLYDSNVMNRGSGDGVTRVSPRVGILVETPRTRLAADYRLHLHAYDTGTAENSINHRGAIDGLWKLTPRLELGAGATLLVGDDPVLLDRSGVIIPQGAFIDVSARGGAAYRTSRRGTLSAEYTLRLSRFDLAGAPDPLAFDGDEHRVDADFAYRWTRRWTLRALARGQVFTSYGTTTSLGEAAGGGLGAEVRLSRVWRARAQGGPIWTPNGVGWFGLADVTRTGERWRVVLRGVHDLYGGTSAAEAVWSESLQLDGALRLAKSLGVRARAGGYRGGVAPAEDEHVRGVMARAELNWLMWRGMRLDVFAEHRVQDGLSSSIADLDRTVAGVRLVAVAGLDLMSLGETR